VRLGEIFGFSCTVCARAYAVTTICPCTHARARTHTHTHTHTINTFAQDCHDNMFLLIVHHNLHVLVAGCGVRTLCNAGVSAQHDNRVATSSAGGDTQSVPRRLPSPLASRTSSSNRNRTESFNCEEEVGGGLQAWPMGHPGEFDYTVRHAPETLPGAGKSCTCIGWKSAHKEKVMYASSNDVDPLETPYTGSTLDLIHGQVHPFHETE
jgi:hypothetical protein